MPADWRNDSTMEKKLNRWGEMGFVLGTVLIALGVALQSKGDLGMSMVVSPAYLASLKIPGLSFGTADYSLQALLLIAYCVIVKRFNWRYLLSFLSAFLYGVVLDLILLLMKDVQPQTLGERALFFFIGLPINALGVTFFFRTYLPLQVYELFVTGLTERLGKPLTKMKLAFDISCCTVAIIMSLLFFGKLRGVGAGTIICALSNGLLIGVFGKFLDKRIDFSPALPKLYEFMTKK